MDWWDSFNQWLEFLWALLEKDIWLFGDYSVKVYHMIIFVLVVLFVGVLLSTRRKK